MFLWVVATCITITTCSAQKPNNQGFIQMRINVTEDNKHFYDNNTIVTIDCISDKLSFNDTSSNFILILHPNKEYVLIFKRPDCISKVIFISTININQANGYIINTRINLEKGDNPVISDLYGKLIYNNKTDSFEQTLLTTKINKNANNYQK